MTQRWTPDIFTDEAREMFAAGFDTAEIASRLTASHRLPLPEHVIFRLLARDRARRRSSLARPS